jgi:hypothetical protein
MEPNQISKPQLWTGRIISLLAVLFMLMDGVMKLFKPQMVVDATVKLGYVEHHVVTIGVCVVIATILYVIPRTSVLGAVLLTAHLGGAVASNFRLDNPLFSHTLFPVYIAVLLWGGLWLRDEKLQAVFPFRK